MQARELGVARIRLLPKLTGMRPLVNLGRPSFIRFRGAVQVGGKNRGGGGTIIHALLWGRTGGGAGKGEVGGGGIIHTLQVGGQEVCVWRRQVLRVRPMSVRPDDARQAR